MPSPLGHVIGGIAAGWVVAGAPRDPAHRGHAWREAALFGALGALPDVDLLIGSHRGPSHSIGAAVVVGVLAFALRRGSRTTRIPWFALACAVAYASHILLDWLASDTSPPLGIMALWPFSRAYFESDLHIFMAVSRRYYQPWVFIVQNVLAVGREVLILLPIVGLVAFVRPRRPDVVMRE